MKRTLLELAVALAAVGALFVVNGVAGVVGAAVLALYMLNRSLGIRADNLRLFRAQQNTRRIAGGQ